MDKRRRQPDADTLRRQRAEFLDAVSGGRLTLQDAVKQMRELSGLTQPEFARHRGVSVRVIREIERGSGNPTVGTLNQIGAIFGLEVTFVRRIAR